MRALAPLPLNPLASFDLPRLPAGLDKINFAFVLAA
jgi:hypothetical protein